MPAEPEGTSRVIPKECKILTESVTGGIWSPDPACYLTDAEIAVDSSIKDSGQRGESGKSGFSDLPHDLYASMNLG